MGVEGRLVLGFHDEKQAKLERGLRELPAVRGQRENAQGTLGSVSQELRAGQVP